MEEDIDEVLLRLTNKSVMQDKSNAKFNLTSTNNVLDLESESDDCCTSVSQRPVNPLSMLGTSPSNSLPLPAVKMVTSDRFWQGQAENIANDNTEDLSELSSSVGTFSVESRKKHPVIFSEWHPILNNKKLQITGVSIDGSVDTRSIDRRISGYIFYDKSEVPCSLGGPMTLLNSQPKFIQHKFALGIPEDWVQVQSIWNSFEKLGSPDNFAWLSSTDLDTSDADLTVTGYDQSVIPSVAISTPRNSTTNFYNMTTEISKINAVDGLRSYPQKLFQHTVNSTANRSMKKTYTSAVLKKKMNKIRSMLKVTLMRECSKLSSFNELVELQEGELNMSACNVQLPADNDVPQPKTITSECSNEYLLQNKPPEHLVIKNLSKNSDNIPTTSQSKIITLAKPENSLDNKIAISNNTTDSSKTASNVFLHKSQFLLKNKSDQAVKDIPSCWKNSGKTKLPVAETNKTTLANVSHKLHEYVSQQASVSGEMSELYVSANQSSKTNSSEKKLLKNSAVFKASVNNSKNAAPPSTSGEEVCNYVPSQIFRKHRNSLTLLLNKNAIEHKSVSCNSSELDNLDSYPSHLDSVVVSFQNINEIDVPSDVNSVRTATNNSSDVRNVSRKNSVLTEIHNNKVIQSEEHHLESLSEDSIFSIQSKKAANTNNEKFNTRIYETSVNKDNQNLNHSSRVISQKNQNSYQINKRATANVDIPHYDKNVNEKVIRNKILFSSESSDNDDDQNQINKPANRNAEIRNKPNFESSDDGSVNSILVTKSSNVKRMFESESSDNETPESHVTIVTNAIVHAAVKAGVKSGQEHPHSNMNKSGTRINRKVVGRKSNEKCTNDNLEIISSAKELTDDKFANRSSHKIKSPQKRNNSLLERKDKKKTKGKKSHEEDEATNQNIMQEDSPMQFAEETIQKQSLPEPRHTPKNSKKRNNAKRGKDTIQNETSISTNRTLECDASLNNTTFSRRGRARCPTLPFWTGARFVTVGDETMVTNVSALNSSSKVVESKKRLLTPQKQSTVAKIARTKTPQKSPVNVLNTELTVLSSTSSAETKQQNKRIATPKNTKNKTQESRVRTTKNTKLNILSCSSNDSKRNNCIDNVQRRYSTRNSRSGSYSHNKINKNTDVVSSDFCTSPIPTDEKQSSNKDPVKPPRSVSKKNIRKLLHDDNASAKCSSKSKDAKKHNILNKVRKNTTTHVDRDINISIVKENGKRAYSPTKSKIKDIYQNTPLQREADINIKFLDNLCFTPKSNKITKLPSNDSGVEINNINYTDEVIKYESTSVNERNIKLNYNKTLQMNNTNTEIDKNNDKRIVDICDEKEIIYLQSEVVANKHEIDDQSKYSKKRNAKTEKNKRRQKSETENRINKKTVKKHEVHVEGVMVKQLRSRGISLETPNNVPKSHGSNCITNLKPQTLVESRTKPSKAPKKLTSKQETHEITVRKVSPNKRQLRSNSVSLPSIKQKKNRNRSSKKSKNDDNSLEQSTVTNSNTDERKTFKNNQKNSSNELAISKERVKKSKKLKQNTTEDTSSNVDSLSSIPNRSKRSKKYNMADGGIDYNFSESNARKTGKHKRNSTQTVDHLYDRYINNKCIALVTPLSAEETEKFTKDKSPESRVQSTMNDQESSSVNQTINVKTSRSAPKNIINSSKPKSRSSSKKPRKRKTFGETYFGDPLKMSLMDKLKRKRQPKAKQSIDTTDSTANSLNKSINSTNNVTRKTGKRKLYNDSDWLNSKECLQMFAEIVEPRSTQNFCLQVEENNAEHDYFDDDVISEVSALAKV